MSDAVDMVAAVGGEVITYIPHNGTATSFKAVIERNRTARVESAGGVQYGAQVFEVWIPVDATNGVLAVQERKDRIRFKKRLADAEATEFVVGRLLNEDGGMVAADSGMFHLEVQA